VIDSSLCYLIRGDEVLMLHRTRKKNDMNHDKWIAVGGHFEAGETPEQCALREVKEETGLTMTAPRYRGIVTFINDQYETERMHLFTSETFEGEMTDCDEGELVWVRIAEMDSLSQWEGDRIFHRLLKERIPFFELELVYSGEKLLYAELNGKRLQN
jgi:8-oxo-dGTP diphosphatase